jgi:hypothetical protein
MQQYIIATRDSFAEWLIGSLLDGKKWEFIWLANFN